MLRPLWVLVVKAVAHLNKAATTHAPQPLSRRQPVTPPPSAAGTVMNHRRTCSRAGAVRRCTFAASRVFSPPGAFIVRRETVSVDRVLCCAGLMGTRLLAAQSKNSANWRRKRSLMRPKRRRRLVFPACRRVITAGSRRRWPVRRAMASRISAASSTSWTDGLVPIFLLRLFYSSPFITTTYLSNLEPGNSTRKLANKRCAKKWPAVPRKKTLLLLTLHRFKASNHSQLMRICRHSQMLHRRCWPFRPQKISKMTHVRKKSPWRFCRHYLWIQAAQLLMLP